MNMDWQILLSSRLNADRLPFPRSTEAHRNSTAPKKLCTNIISFWFLIVLRNEVTSSLTTVKWQCSQTEILWKSFPTKTMSISGAPNFLIIGIILTKNVRFRAFSFFFQSGNHWFWYFMYIKGYFCPDWLSGFLNFGLYNLRIGQGCSYISWASSWNSSSDFNCWISRYSSLILLPPFYVFESEKGFRARICWQGSAILTFLRSVTSQVKRQFHAQFNPERPCALVSSFDFRTAVVLLL